MLAKRPLLFTSLFFVAGMYILSVCDVINVILLSLGISLVLLFVLIRKKRAKNLFIFLLCMVMFLLGAIRYNVSDYIESKEIYKLVGRDDIEITAEIVEKTKINENSISFTAYIILVKDGASTHNTNEKVRFSTYIEDKEKIDDYFIPEIGDVVTVKGKIVLPNASMNTGGFDYANYLKSEDIFFQATYKNESIEKIGYKEHPVLLRWNNFRERCISFFDEVFPEDESAVLKAYITGDKSTISDEVAGNFSRSGLSHILAVSGLHVSVFISLIVSVLKFLKTSKRKEMAISAAAAMFFVFFTGASVSALRAGVLSMFAFIAKLIYRKSDPITTLSFAAALFCLVNPHVIYDASFMLSFSATAGILIFYETISKALSKIYSKASTKPKLYKVLREFFNSIAVGISAQIFVLPCLIYLFNGFSLTSIIATVIISPILTPLLAGGLLFICVSFINKTVALPIGGFIFILTKVMIFVAEKFASFTLSKVIFGEITFILLLLYALFIAVIIFAIKKYRKAYIASIISFTLFFTFNVCCVYYTRDIARITFINVGQGDCTLIKAPGNCDILIDAGGYSESESTGKYIITPYLIKSGVTDVEYVIISHMHSDHIIGLLGIMDEIIVKKLIIPYGQINTEDAEAIIRKAKEKDVEILYFTRGDKLKITDDMKITALSPDSRQGMYAEDHNDFGTVVRFDYGETSFLFTGDITSDVEKYLVENYREELEADVLKVSHHGSKNSSCEEFLNSVKAKYAYIPVGNNYYGHPAPETLERLKNSGIKVFRADIENDVTFYFNNTEIIKVSY